MSVREPQMIEIPAGRFTMGSESGRDDEKPAHDVSIHSFLIGKYTVTNQEYQAFARAHEGSIPPFYHQQEFNHPRQPVVGVNWFEAYEYCRWLRKATGRLYRLPTEAEWEYVACSGSSANIYPWGNRSWEEWPEIHQRFQNGPEVVGCFTPNAFGVFDMGMNVHEWCADWYDASYYHCSPTNNPTGPPAGTRRSSKGGSWRHRIKITRCAARSSIPPGMRYADYGFRVALDMG